MPDTENDVAPAFQQPSLVDRGIRFLIGAVLAAVGMIAVSGLLEPIADVFFPVTGVLAVAAGLASAFWGERFLRPLLRILGRI
jgi:hypothetical protein